MTHILTYLIESSLILSVMYLFYNYLYYKTAYFTLCRYFLLFSLVLAVFMPFLSTLITAPEAEYQHLRASFIDIRYGETGNTALISYDNIPTSHAYVNSVIQIIFAIWLSGTLIKLFGFMSGLRSIFRLKSKSEQKKSGAYTFIYTGEEKSGAFSFFNSIFLNNDFLKLSEAEQNQIIEHEKVHADQKHSLDNILFEIATAAFWFNPLINKLKGSVKEVHEFITDNEITGNKNKPDYSRLLLKMALSDRISALKSPFSEKIKTRIKLIASSEPDKIRKMRFAGSVPVIILTVGVLFWAMSILNASTGISFINKGPMICPLENQDYTIASPFFEHKIIRQESGDTIRISHPLISYATSDYANVKAVTDGKIIKIDTLENYMLKEISLTMTDNSGQNIRYSRLYKVNVKIGDYVKKAQIIGQTGESRLYPIMEMKITKKDGSPVNPILCY